MLLCCIYAKLIPVAARRLTMNIQILTACFNAILPTFLMMAVGFLSRQLRLLDGDDVSTMNGLAFKLFLPIMLFRNIYSSDLTASVNPKLLLYAVLAVLASFGLSIAYTLLAVKDRSKRSVYIQGIYRSNFVVIGLPLASALIEDAEVSSVALLTAVVVPLFNVLAVICLEAFSGRRVKPLTLLLDVTRNPLILAAALGVLCSAWHITLPTALESALADLSKIGSPLAIFLLGAFFRFDSIRRHARDLVRICTMRLVVMPAIFLGLAFALGFRGVEFAGLIGIFASATAVSSFTMAQHMGGDSELAGDIVISTSILCSISLYLWSILFKSLHVI